MCSSRLPTVRRPCLSAPWSLEDAELVTSLYALEEARRNLSARDIGVLHELVAQMTIVAGVRSSPVPAGIELADKDIPILLAAIDSGCSHLLTGDRRHFESLYGKRSGGVLVQTPAQYLRSNQPGGWIPELSGIAAAESEQQIPPALRPESTMPLSQASLRITSTPVLRQILDLLAVLPPPT